MVTIVTAASAETGTANEWEAAVLEITKALVGAGLAHEPWGGLGGYWSYATEYSNDTFTTHQYCWCERDDCPYCSGCQCDEDAFWYTVNGVQCSWEEYDLYYKKQVDAVPNRKDHAARLRAGMEANKHRSWGQHDHIKCDYCKGTKFAEHGQIEGWGVPLFWHKPSGVRMLWYKWVGRDTKIYIPEGCEITPAEVLADCLKSIGVNGG